MIWDVLLIGSGISCLTTALLLARSGRSVCIIEKHTKPGGYLHCFNRFGLRYETGGHYIGAMDPGQPFRVLLEYLNVYDPDLFVPLDPEGFDVCEFRDFSFSFPKSYERFEQKLIEAFPQEKEGIKGYLKYLRETVHYFPTYHFQTEIQEAPLAKALSTSVKEVVESFITTPRLQTLLYAHCSIHGVNPEHMAFGLHALVVDSFIVGPYGFKNGAEEIAKRFVREIEKLGGKVILRAKVTDFTTENKEVSGVVLATGELVKAKTVISGVHPKTTFGWIPSLELKPAFLERIKNLKESESLLGIYGYSKERLPFHPLKNYYLFQTEDPKTLMHTRKVNEEPGIVFAAQVHRTLDTLEKYPFTLHSAAQASWFNDFTQTEFNKRPEAYETFKEKLALNTFHATTRFFPDFKSKVEAYEVSTPLSNLHFNGSVQGTAYGIYHSMDCTGPRSLGPRTHFKNLFLTGQNTLCPGILGAAISGLRTAGHLIGIKPILRELEIRST